MSRCERSHAVIEAEIRDKASVDTYVSYELSAMITSTQHLPSFVLNVMRKQRDGAYSYSADILCPIHVPDSLSGLGEEVTRFDDHAAKNQTFSQQCLVHIGNGIQISCFS